MVLNGKSGTVRKNRGQSVPRGGGSVMVGKQRGERSDETERRE